MSFFISDAMAAGSTAAHSEGMYSSIFMIVAMVVLFYFMLIRPQNKRAKDHRDLMTNLKKGDEIVTAGGIVAKVVAIGEQYITVSPSEGVEMKMQKSSVSTVLPKGTIKSI